MTHQWATWLHNPRRLGGPQLESEGHNQTWPKSGQIDCITAAALRVPDISERMTKSLVSHK